MARLNRTQNAQILFLVIGLGIGFGTGFFVAPSRTLRALSPESTDSSLLMSCIVSMEYNDARKVQTPVEGLVYLDYRRGKLVGTMPELRQIGQQSKYLSNFTERDLVEDFQIEPGTTPRFMMSAIAAGAMTDGVSYWWFSIPRVAKPVSTSSATSRRVSSLSLSSVWSRKKFSTPKPTLNQFDQPHFSPSISPNPKPVRA